MNLRTLRLYVEALAMLVILQSCSIKEDRSECPCRVSVKTQTNEECLVYFLDENTAILNKKTMLPDELCQGENYTDIRKGSLTVSVLQSPSEVLIRGSHIVSCRSGAEADPLYAWTVHTEAIGEDLLVQSSLQKQYAEVTVHLVGNASEEFPNEVKIQSALGGLDLYTLEAAKGEGFSIKPKVEDGACRFRILRQKNSEPIMLYLEDSEDGSVTDSVDLNRYIALSGYNWDADSLDDINVDIDYVKMTISISIEGWSDWEVFTLFE